MGSRRERKSHKGNTFTFQDYKYFCLRKKKEYEHSPPRINIGTAVVQRLIQILKNFILSNLEEKIGFILYQVLFYTKSVYQVQRVMWVTVHIGLKVTMFEIHYGRIVGTDLPNIFRVNKSCFSNSRKIKFSVMPKLIPIYVGRKKEMWWFPCFLNHGLMKKKPVKPISGNFERSNTVFFEKKSR